MTHVPAHRRKRDPFARHIPGVLKRPAMCKCAHRMVDHEDRIGGQLVRVPCRVSLCGCKSWRPEAS